jgi:pyruvate-formate lyase-activating enzyme
MDLPFAFTPSRNKPIAEVYLPGCNLACDFCVGPYLSRIANIRGIRWVESADLVRAVAGSVDGLVFSGGDPAIHPEYLTEVFSECRERRMFTGLETNGYMTRSTAEKLAKYTDFIAIGLKASLDPDFYKQRLGIVDTQPIREAAKVFAESGCDMLLTNLTDPKLWEDKQAFEATTEWIVQNLGPDTRLVLGSLERGEVPPPWTEERIHITPREERQPHLERYRKIAMEAGLQQVFCVFRSPRVGRRPSTSESPAVSADFDQAYLLSTGPHARQWSG